MWMALCGWLGVPTLTAQGPVHLRELTGKDGLSEATNEFLHRAADGRMYISSLDGTNVFDGHTVRVYREQPGDSPSGYQGTANQSPFFETTQGDIWFGTDKALVKRDGKTDAFTSYHLGSANERALYYPFALEQDRYLWLVYAERVYRLDLAHPTELACSPPVAATGFIRGIALRDDDGNVTEIWGGFWYLPGVVRLRIDPRTQELAGLDTLRQTRDGRPIPPVENWGLLPDGSLLATAKDRLLVFSEPDRETYRAYPYPAELGPVAAPAIRCDGEVWLLGRRGLAAFIPENGFRMLSGPEGPFPESYGKGNALYLDLDRPGHRELVWIGQRGRGLYYGDLAANRFRDYLADNRVPPIPIQALLPGTSDGLFARTDNAWSFFDAAGRRVRTLPGTDYLFKVDDALWRVDGENLLRWRNTTASWQPVGISAPGGGFQAHLDLGKGRWLFAQDMGGILFDAGEKQWYSQTVLGDVFIVALAPFGNDRIATVDGSGIVRLHPLHRSAAKEGGPRAVVGAAAYESPSLGIVTDLTYDAERRVLWVTSTAGLYAIDPDRPNPTYYTTDDGLAQTNLQSIVLTPGGELWLASNSGIFNFRPDPDWTGPRFHFTQEEGLSADEFTPGAALRLADGRLCFGSLQGLDVFHPDSLRVIRNPPRPMFRELRYHNQLWRGDKSIARTEGVRLPYDENTLSFVVAANEFSNPRRTRSHFYVQTDGGPVDTIELEDNRLTLANLSPAEYRFGFNAASATGAWAEAPAWLAVSITPHWSQTVWFRTLLVFFALLVVSLVTAFWYRYQLRVQEAINAEERRKAEVREAQLQREIELEEQRRRITSQMHNDIGGSLTTLSMLSSRLNRTEELDTAKDINERIVRWVKDIRLRFSTFLRVVNPSFDTLQKSVQLLRLYAAELLTDNDVRVTFDFPTEYSDERLSPDFRSALWELTQEVLHNILKYARAREVAFRVRVNAEAIELTFADDGVGFSPAPEDYEKGIGLSSLRQLAECFGGSVHYQVQESGGTITTCVLQLEKAGRAEATGL